MNRYEFPIPRMRYDTDEQVAARREAARDDWEARQERENRISYQPHDDETQEG